MNIQRIAKNKSWKNHLFLILASVFMMYPVFWWIGASLKTNEEMRNPNIFPEVPMWSNFTEGWKAIPNFTFTTFYLNTFYLIGLVVVFTLLSCSLAAFAFARLDFPLKGMWFAILLVTLMLPSQVTMVPQYVMFNSWNWVNTYLPFFVPHLLAGGISGSFCIFLMVQFIRGIPKDLDESAKMDGCSWFGIYWRIIIPLLKPALVSAGIYCFLWNWDDFLGHLIYINSVDKFTVGLALRMFVDTQSAMPWGQLLAMSLLSIVPSIIIFFLAQRHFVDGMTAGSVKG